MMSKMAKFAMMTSGMMFLGLGNSCLPDDFWANKLGEIVNGIIIGIVSLSLDGAGIPFGA
jgi:hypothetical protein